MDYGLVSQFLFVAIVLTLAPGPDILFVMAQSISHGRKAGIVTALGLCTGVTVHTIAAATGISVILSQSNAAFQFVKYAGALYLLYLAWQAFNEKGEIIMGKAAEKRGYPSLYQKGILMNVLNPKVSLFFLALLPQFVSAEKGNPTGQMIVLGMVFMLQAIVVFSLVALCAGSMGSKLKQYPRLNSYINKGKAALFVLIAIRIALTEK